MFPSRRITTSGGDVFRDEYSLEFDGSNDYIVIGDPSSLKLGTASCSFAIWIKQDASDEGYIISKRDGAAGQFSVHVQGNGKHRFYLGTVNLVGADFGSAWEYGVWNHLVFVYDHGSGTTVDAIVYKYLNGALDTTDDDLANPSTTIDDNQGWRINGRFGAGDAMTGSTGLIACNISEIAIYNKVLSGSEVATLYNGREPYNHKEGIATSNLKGWWRMGDGRLDRFDSNGLIGDEVAPTIASDLITDGNFPDGDNWTENSWTIGSNKASLDGTQGGVVNLIQTGLSTIEGKTVKVVFEITDYTAGNVQLLVGGTPYTESGLFNSVGVHTFYAVVIGAEGYLTIQGDANFNGSLSNVTLQILNGSPGIMINMAATDFTGDIP